VVVVKFYITFLQGILYLQFAKSVTDKVIHVRENMWCMPSYNPKNAALSVCMFLLLLHVPIFKNAVFYLGCDTSRSYCKEMHVFLSTCMVHARPEKA
jgi:hypothetical protein